MTCHNCGGSLEKLVTNLPFKVEYVIEDAVMKKVDDILSNIDRTTELEVLSYAV